jgi:hypothetical protein
MAYAASFPSDTNCGGIDLYLLNKHVSKQERKLRDNISTSLDIIRENCEGEKYNGSTSRVVRSYLDLAYDLIRPMGDSVLREFMSLIKPLESPDIGSSELEARLKVIEQMAFH